MSSPKTQSPVGADISEIQLYLEHDLICLYSIYYLKIYKIKVLWITFPDAHVDPSAAPNPLVNTQLLSVSDVLQAKAAHIVLLYWVYFIKLKIKEIFWLRV